MRPSSEKRIIVFAIVIAASALCVWISCSTSSQSGFQNVLIVTGGHNFEREPFFDMFRSFRQITFKELVQPEANQQYKNMKGGDAVLVFYDMFQEIQEDEKREFIRLLNEGTGVVFLHHSLASYQNWDEYLDILGGRYHLKPKDGVQPEHTPSTYRHDVNVDVRIMKPEHPVTDNLDDFSILDEVYGGFEVLPVVKPILSTLHPESGPIIGWIHEYALSRVVYIQLGHDHHAYENIHYRQLVEQAIRWVGDN